VCGSATAYDAPINSISGGNVTIKCSFTENNKNWNVQRKTDGDYNKMDLINQQNSKNSDKYSISEDGQELTITNLDRETDEALYQCNEKDTGVGNTQQLIVNVAPTGLKLETLETPSLMTYHCKTEGKSKPVPQIKMYLLKADATRASLPPGKRSCDRDAKDDQFASCQVNGGIPIGEGDQLEDGDQLVCELDNAKTQTHLEQHKKFLAPSVAGIKTFPEFLREEIYTGTYETQKKHTTKNTEGLVEMFITREAHVPNTELYQMNEPVTFSMEFRNDEFYPAPSFKWYVQEEGGSSPAEIGETDDHFTYNVTDNLTVYCLVKNCLGKVLIKAEIGVDPNAIYTKQQPTADADTTEVNGANTTVLMIVLALVVAMCIVAIITILYRRRQQRRMDSRYETAKVAADQREIHLQDISSNVENVPYAAYDMEKQVQPPMVEKESLVQRNNGSNYDSPPHSDNEDDALSGHGRTSSLASVSNVDDGSYLSGKEDSRYDGLSVRSGSTICIDDLPDDDSDCEELPHYSKHV